MFLDLVLQRNPKLIEAAFSFHQQGILLPDTYIIDGDAFDINARAMATCAKENNVLLYAMTKQIARIPLLAKRTIDAGFEGVVCVDHAEALQMVRAGVKIGNVGHLVQIPLHALEEIIAAKPEVITVYSIEKIEQINDVATKLDLNQPLLLKVLDKNDLLYPQQEAGFYLNELEKIITLIESLPNVSIAGVTHFPCFLLNNETQLIEPTANAQTVLKGADLLAQHGYTQMQINLPSSTCCSSIPMIAELGGTHGEPGHGLTGTTPFHNLDTSATELPSMVYLSEISHHHDSHSFCYGGGHYRRSFMNKALVNNQKVNVSPLAMEAIDYHFELEGMHKIGDPVIMSFRTQLFVTRSQVAIVDGIQSGIPVLRGLYSSLGKAL